MIGLLVTVGILTINELNFWWTVVFCHFFLSIIRLYSANKKKYRLQKNFTNVNIHFALYERVLGFVFQKTISLDKKKTFWHYRWLADNKKNCTFHISGLFITNKTKLSPKKWLRDIFGVDFFWFALYMLTVLFSVNNFFVNTIYGIHIQLIMLIMPNIIENES